MKILTYPNKILRKKSELIKIEEIQAKKFSKLCLDMEKSMNNNKGIGLAAPQVGQNIRLIVIKHKDGCLFMFNPEIVKKSEKIILAEEGCLSVPKVFGQVERSFSLTCVYYNELGEKKKVNAKGLFARVVQHEIDHLDGVLFVDKISRLVL